MRFFLLLILPILAKAQSVILIGGNLKDDNVPIWTTMVEKAGGPGKARIGIIVTSPDNTAKATKVADNFLRIYGAREASVITLTKVDANNPVLAERVKESSTGIFLVDEESNMVDTLRPSGVDTLVFKAIKTIANNGGMVAGNSGIMGNAVRILGGDSMNALVMGTKFEQTFNGSRSPLIYTEIGGLGFLNNYVLDSHFSEKGRELRLIRTLLESRDLPTIGTPKGLGIDENTALVVTNLLTHPIGKVITAPVSVSGVFFVDVSGVNTIYEKIPFSFITTNDTIDLITEEVKYASWKIPLAGEEWFEDAIPSSDIFSSEQPAQWRQTNRRLIDCKEVNVSCFSSLSVFPRVQVFFDRLQAVGFGADIPNDPDKTYVASFRNMIASIRHIEM